MNDEEKKFVDNIRDLWFSGKTENTPNDILSKIPLHIRKLVNIIDKLDNELIDMKSTKFQGVRNGKREKNEKRTELLS
jgi:hypothetical protein